MLTDFGFAIRRKRGDVAGVSSEAEILTVVRLSIMRAATMYHLIGDET